MGNSLVDLVCEAMRSTAFANGVSDRSLGPLADVVVAKLWAAGFSDEEIERIFAPEEAP